MESSKGIFRGSVGSGFHLRAMAATPEAKSQVCGSAVSGGEALGVLGGGGRISLLV